ncbi:MAG TPA: hypothetical protein VFB35_05885 [Gaiellaceae bacterium]|nr:hypothetical protein [Gaiellaceae bacterium]
MRRQLALLAWLGAACVLGQPAALGAPGEPQKRLTAADTQLARRVLLARGELGAGGWRPGRGSATGQACGIVRRVQPRLSDLVETADVSGPLFTSERAEAVAQTVRVFATPGQAAVAWTRTVNTHLVICMEEQVEGSSSMGAPVSVTDWRALTLPHVTQRVAGFRVTALATAGKTRSNVYLDVILLAQGRAMTTITFSSVQRPVPAAYETQLVRTVAGRLRAAAHMLSP